MSNLTVSKNIRIFSTQGNDFTISSTSNTWGELQAELSNDISSISNMKAIIQHNKQTLEFNSSILPSQDFILFLTPKKVKSGSDQHIYNVSEVSTMKYNELRSIASKLGIGVAGSKEEIKNRVITYLKNTNPANKQTTSLIAIVKNYENAPIEKKVDILKDRLKKVLASKTYDEVLLEEINVVTESFEVLIEESSILNTKINKIHKSLEHVTSYVETIIEVEAEVMPIGTNKVSVSTDSTLNIDPIKLELELLGLQED